MKQFLTRASRILLVNFAVAAFGANAQTQTAIMTVNDLPVMQSELNRLKLANPFFTLELRGVLKTDQQNLLVNQLILTKAFDQALESIEVTDEEVGDTVLIFRESLGLRTEAEYNARLSSLGFSDQEYRESVRNYLRSQKYTEKLQSSVKASPSEVEFYYNLFKNDFAQSGRIPPLARIRAFIQSNADFTKGYKTLEMFKKDLVQRARVTIPEGSSLSVYNPVVVKVGSTEVLLSDLNRSMYQYLPSMSASINMIESLTPLFSIVGRKSDYLADLIDNAIATETAKKSGKPFINDSTTILTAVKLYKTTDVKVSEAEVKAYYQKNLEYLKQPGSASITSVSFSNQTDANGFKSTILKSNLKLKALSDKFKGVIDQYGITNSDVLSGFMHDAIFSQVLARSKLGLISDVTITDSGFEVYIVNDFKPEIAKPFASVKNLLTTALLGDKRSVAAENWLKSARKTLKIENNLKAIIEESEARGQ
jgi:parvulin-like peptidyl-prolyl isomerase